MQILHQKRHVSSGAIILAIFGVLMFFYGLVLSAPTLLRGSLFIRASILPNSIGEVSKEFILRADPASAQGAFTLAVLLIIFGAALDVWQRLCFLHHPMGDAASSYFFEEDGHDPVLDEMHVW